MSGSTKVIAIHFSVMIPLQAIAVAACFLRAYTRIFITKLRLSVEDWSLGAALTISGACALAIAVSDVHFGEGLDAGNSPQGLRMRISLYQTQWSTSIFYALENFFFKTSVLLLYRRIFAFPLFHALCTFLLYFNGAAAIANIFAFAFVCQPVEHFWLQVVPGLQDQGRCIDFRAVWIAFGIINVITDFVAVLLPLPVLRNLHTQRRKRKFLMWIFAFSLLPCIASVIRIYTLRDITGQNLGLLIWQHDLWCGIEMSLAITCACLPTLTPFASRYFPGLLEGLGAQQYGRGRRRRAGGCDGGRRSDEEEDGGLRDCADVDIAGGAHFVEPPSNKCADERERRRRMRADSRWAGHPGAGRRVAGRRGGRRRRERLPSPATTLLARAVGLDVAGGLQQAQQQGDGPRHYWWWRSNALLYSDEGDSPQDSLRGGERANAVMLRDLPPVVDVDLGSGRGSLGLDISEQRHGGAEPAAEISREPTQDQSPKSSSKSARTTSASSSLAESAQGEGRLVDGRSWLR